MLIEKLTFLQKLVTKIREIRSCLYWKKQAVLRIFANWCAENANDVGLASWECLSDDMTLFDVVYLDIVHEFDVPNDALLEYVNKGWSAELVSRLGICYSFNRLDQRKHRDGSNSSIHFKTLLLMQHAIDHEYVSIETISACVSLLIKHKEYEIVAHVLESGADELWRNEIKFHFDNVFFSIVSSKTKNDLREISVISQMEFNIKYFKISVRIFFCYASYVCYKNLENGERLHEVRNQMISCFSRTEFPEYLDFLLFLEVFEYDSKMRPFYHNQFMYCKTMVIVRLQKQADHIIEKSNSLRNGNNNNYRQGIERNNQDFSDPRFELFCSCNRVICHVLKKKFLGRSRRSYDPDDTPENRIALHTKSTADRMYHVLVLLFINKYEQAAALLNAVIDEEGEYSLSVVICPYAFWESNFLDDNLRRELKKLSADLVVIPTDLFARYLLVKVSISLGQMEQWQRNMTEFNIL